MTRYARAIGSKASNARLPADPTPWSEMAPTKAVKAESVPSEVATPKKDPKIVKLRSGTPKTPVAAQSPSQLMSPPTSAVSSAKKLSRKTPLNVRAAINSSIMNTPDNLLTPKAGKVTDPSPLQTRSARKRKAEMAAMGGTPVKGATPSKAPASAKKNTKAIKAEVVEEPELCLKLDEDAMDSDDLDSDDDQDKNQDNVDQAAIDKLVSEAKNAKATPVKKAKTPKKGAKVTPIAATEKDSAAVVKSEDVEMKEDTLKVEVISEPEEETKSPAKEVESITKSTEDETAMKTEAKKETTSTNKKRRLNAKNKKKALANKKNEAETTGGTEDIKENTLQNKWNPSEKISVSMANEERFNKIRDNLLSSGKPVEEVENELKKIRRSMLKRLSHTRCLRCRHRGHMQKDCPQTTSATKCYKCGETNHISKACPMKNEVYKFAECFICHEVGHLTRTCPSNTNGIYPRGGSCFKCNEKTHLARDCTKALKDKHDENIEPKEKAVLVGTLDNKLSGDADVADIKPVVAKKGKRKSVVKF